MTRNGPLRVAVVSPRYAPDIGGVEENVAQVAARGGRFGIAADVLTTDPSGRLPQAERLAGVTVRRFPTLRGDQVYFVSPRLARWLHRHGNTYDLIHVHSYHTGLGLEAAGVSRVIGVPYVISPHYHGTGHSRLRSILHVGYRPFGHALLRGAKSIICNTEAEADQLRGDVGGSLPITTVEPGIDLDQLRRAEPIHVRDDRTVVLAVGRLEPYKQTAQVIRALTLLPAHFHAVIIGVGPAAGALEAMILEHGLTDRVQMLGTVSRETLSSWYRSADVAVALSLYEAFGLTLAEAAGAGATVVASDIGAHRDVARLLPEDRIILISPTCTPQDLARTIQEAASRRTRGEIVSAVRSWEDTARGISDVYRAVVSGHRST